MQNRAAAFALPIALPIALALAACSPAATTDVVDGAADAVRDDTTSPDGSMGNDVVIPDGGGMDSSPDGRDAFSPDGDPPVDAADVLPPLDVPPAGDGGTVPECVLDDTNARSANGDSRFVSAVWTGSEYGIAWQDDADGPFNIRFARVTAAGAVIDDYDITAESAPGGATNEYPSLVWDGTRYWVAWARTPVAPTRASIRLASITVGGAAGITVGDPISVPTMDGDGDTQPSMIALPASAGGGLALVWEDGRNAGNHEIYFARFTSAGARMGSEVRVTNAMRYSGFPRLAFNARDNELGLLWQDDRDNASAATNEELYFARLTPAGARPSGAADVRITTDTVRSIWQSIAFDGSGYGVAWVNEDNNDDTPFTYFLRVDAAGARASGAMPVRLSSAPNPNREYSTATAWNGSEFLVAFQDNRVPHLNGDLIVRRVTPAGRPLGSEYFMADDRTTSDHASLIWGNGEWFIAWEDDRDSHRDIWFRRMPRDFCIGL